MASKSRIGVVESIIHQTLPDQPTDTVSRYTRELATHEQPWKRKVTVTEEWQTLDIGWITSCSLLHIENTEGTVPTVVPTPVERIVLEAKVVQLAFLDCDDSQVWLIPPRESFRGCPLRPGKLRVRCQKGAAECMLTVFPG